ncbi:cyclophilin-like domain-containing protein [Kickxella alabastrina]|uniref:cyclophilin-like domain-containing protein n=1 Tax=Kickxella alabastrina TaxID=61397 RepID=UPI00221EA63B|nr:cyclophilin-like domain-containing protein [Kickxella alabastrina]KAI7825429.1 cyclophilin-like domain-containing protein [Kickxella alabastrina]
MSVLIETSLGDLVIDLHHESSPILARHFLTHCFLKTYSFSRIHQIQSNYTAQTGKQPSSSTYIPAYFPPKSTHHHKRGTVSLTVTNQTTRGIDGIVGTEFFFTLGGAASLEHLDGRHAIIGEITEGLDVLDQINHAMCDSKGAPLKDILLRHLIVLHDPFSISSSLSLLPSSPLLPDRDQLERIEAGDKLQLDSGISDKSEERKRLNLEMIGDLPFADIKPAENILFVCKLNPLTNDEDLRTIFSRFGKIISCDVVRDPVDKRSLGYAFVEFSERRACEEAYFRMEGVLVDDRRIHVDFSQSVAKVAGKWTRTRGGRNGAGGGLGAGLRMKRQQRGGAAERRGEEYEMVFDTGTREQRRAGSGSSRHRSRSPSSHGKHGK